MKSKALYFELTQRLAGHALWGERVQTYVRHKTEHRSLTDFHNNGATEEEKRNLYADCLRAILKNAPNMIAVPPLDTVKPKAEVSRDDLALVEDPDPLGILPKPAAPSPTAPPPPAPPAPPAPTLATDLGALIAAAVAPHVRHGLDEERVRAIAYEAAHAVGADAVIRACDKAKEMIDAIPKSVTVTVIEVKRFDGSKVNMSGQHRQFGTVLSMVSARKLHSGQPVPVYCYGAPGGGKSHMMAGVAKALGMEERFYPYSCSPTDTGSKMIGFNSMAMGDYIPGVLYKPFKEGGLAVISEVDLTDGSVLAGINNLIENDRFTFPNGETVPRHEDFHIVCDANTIGKGATGGYTRQKLDAATRTRFAFVKIEYDSELERRLVPGFESWCDYVAKVRTYVEKNCKESAYITPRATINGAALLKAGVPAQTVVESVLLTDFSESTRGTIVANCGEFAP
jgi:hypothetical protein